MQQRERGSLLVTEGDELVPVELAYILKVLACADGVNEKCDRGRDRCRLCF